jgi:hypothetical protein
MTRQERAARIPVFVSAPTALTPDQKTSYEYLLDLLARENLERRALGKSDYPSDYPLKEVVMIARRCAGGLILGYSQATAPELIVKPGVPVPAGEEPPEPKKNAKFPTPWNQLEAGILFSLRLPLMVFREKGISGGIFDLGTSDVFINPLPLGKIFGEEEEQLIFSFQNWVARVREHYRRWE